VDYNKESDVAINQLERSNLFEVQAKINNEPQCRCPAKRDEGLEILSYEGLQTFHDTIRYESDFIKDENNNHPSCFYILPDEPLYIVFPGSWSFIPLDYCYYEVTISENNFNILIEGKIYGRERLMYTSSSGEIYTKTPLETKPLEKGKYTITFNSLGEIIQTNEIIVPGVFCN